MVICNRDVANYRNIAVLTGSQWFQTVSSFSLEKLEAKKCTRMYASGQAIFERLTERLNSSIYYSARFNNT